MYCIVFQMERNKDVVKDKPLTSRCLEEGDKKFIDIVAISTNENTDKEVNIKWLLSCLSSKSLINLVVVNKDKEGLIESILFKKGFKEKYFEDALNNVKAKINSMKAEEFANSRGFDKLDKLVNGSHAFYQYEQDYGYSTFDDFVRNLKYNKIYYFGDTIDYSC